jgi:hypothetical protein
MGEPRQEGNKGEGRKEGIAGLQQTFHVKLREVKGMEHRIFLNLPHYILVIHYSQSDKCLLAVLPVLLETNTLDKARVLIVPPNTVVT